MPRKQLCDFGREVNLALVDVNQPKKWLIEEVARDTDKYFDRSYLHKILTGELATPCIIESIRRILGEARKENPPS